MRATRTLLALAAVTMTLLPATPASAAEVDLVADLHGSATYQNATGVSEYERDSHGREVEVTVRHALSLTGQRLAVAVNHHRVGKITVQEGGYAHRQWDTERGQTVPYASVGDPVRVRAADGTVVARGRYAVDQD